MKKILKKNQIIIYVIALMLMTAGYLNYTSNQQEQSIETSIEMESKDDTQLADIGDATLVNSNDIIGIDDENKNTLNETNTTQAQIIDNNTTNESIETSNATEKQDDDYFTKSKLNRDTMYSQMIETYEKVLNSSNSSEVQKQLATEEITKINQTKNGIMICENLMETKGFKNSVVFVNNESISIVVGTNDLKQEEVAQIQNIIARELNSQIENIHISTK